MEDYEIPLRIFSLSWKLYIGYSNSGNGGGILQKQRGVWEKLIAPMIYIGKSSIKNQQILTVAYEL